MRFHPIVSIISGLVVAVVLDIISVRVFNATPVLGMAVILLGIIIGGFLATYFSKYRKIRYSFYMGLILAVLFAIIVKDNFGLLSVINGFLFFPLVAFIGGLLGKVKYQNTLQTEGFTPIIMLLMVTIVSIVMLSFLLGY